jgi:hypothetical protein
MCRGFKTMACARWIAWTASIAAAGTSSDESFALSCRSGLHRQVQPLLHRRKENDVCGGSSVHRDRNVTRLHEAQQDRHGFQAKELPFPGRLVEARYTVAQCSRRVEVGQGYVSQGVGAKVWSDCLEEVDIVMAYVRYRSKGTQCQPGI